MSGHAMWNVEELHAHADSVGTIAQNVGGAAKVGQPMSGSAYGILGQMFAGQVIATDSSVSASVELLARDVRDHQASLQANARAYQDVEREHTEAFRTMHQESKPPPRVSGGQTSTRSASGGSSPEARSSGGSPSDEAKKNDAAEPATTGVEPKDGKGSGADLDRMGSRLDTLDGRLDELEDEQDRLDEEHRRIEGELRGDDLAPDERERLERRLHGVEREQEKLERLHDKLAGEYDTLRGTYDRLDRQLGKRDVAEPDGSSVPGGDPTADELAEGMDRRPLSLIERALLGTGEHAT